MPFGKVLEILRLVTQRESAAFLIAMLKPPVTVLHEFPSKRQTGLRSFSSGPDSTSE
jgi:hypothetical protein